MTVPIVSSLTREIFTTVPPTAKEGALALGGTRWEMIKTVVLPYSRPGIIAAVMLGLGRAVGEAIAVSQVIGGAPGINAEPLPAGTIRRGPDRRAVSGSERPTPNRRSPTWP